MSRKKLDISADSIEKLESAFAGKIEQFGAALEDKLKVLKEKSTETDKDISVNLDNIVSKTDQNLSKLIESAGSGLQTASDGGIQLTEVIGMVNNSLSMVADAGSFVTSLASGNVFGAIASGTSLLVTGLTMLSDVLEEQQPAWQIQHEQIQAQKAKYDELCVSQQGVMNANLAQIDHTQGLWEELQTLVDANGNVVESDKARARFITEELNKVMPEAIKWNEDDTVSIQGTGEAIDQLLEKKRAQIILEAEEPKYRKAITEFREVEKKQIEARQQLILEEIEVNRLKSEADALEREGETTRFHDKLEEASKAEEMLLKKQEAYKKDDDALNTYYKDITSYETMAADIAAGNFDRINEINQGYGNSFKTASTATKEELQQQVTNAETYTQQLQEKYNQGVDGVTKTMVNKAIELEGKAKTEFDKVGKAGVDGMIKGTNGKKGDLNLCWNNLFDGWLGMSQKKIEMNSPSKLTARELGAPLIEGIGVGFIKSAPKIFSKMSDTILSETSKLSAATATAANFGAIGPRGLTMAGSEGGVIPASGNIKTVLNIDGREFAVATSGYLSEELAWRNS